MCIADQCEGNEGGWISIANAAQRCNGSAFGINDFPPGCVVAFFQKYMLRIAIILLIAAIAGDGFRHPSKQVTSRFLAWVISLYQRGISPVIHMGGRIQMCRFHPTCSEYTRLALLKYGLYKGLAKGVWRVLRCNPFCEGGFEDP